MKKYILAILFITPFAVSAAPSVRVLGNKNVGNTQIVPAKTGTVKTTTNARVGTLKTKTTSSGPSGVLTSNGSRFPVITPAKSYNIVTQPSGGTTSGGNTGTTTPSNTGSCNMCTDTINEIVDTVTNKVEGDIVSNYYDKTEVYNNNEFTEAVKDVDDPRIDAIRTRNPAGLHQGAELPDDYIYVWIEQ